MWLFPGKKKLLSFACGKENKQSECAPVFLVLEREIALRPQKRGGWGGEGGKERGRCGQSRLDVAQVGIWDAALWGCRGVGRGFRGFWSDNVILIKALLHPETHTHTHTQGSGNNLSVSSQKNRLLSICACFVAWFSAWRTGLDPDADPSQPSSPLLHAPCVSQGSEYPDVDLSHSYA